MKLTDLDPRWIERDGRRVALLYRCPGCIAGKCKDKPHWLFTTLEPMKLSDQIDLWDAAFGEERYNVIPSRQSVGWRLEGGPDFDTVSLSPSVDASAAGHWHGFIKRGAIT